jgi:uncharacterized protein (UPF0212 family)
MARLIDADELNKDLDLFDRDFCAHCGNEFAAGFEAARELIADAPTIDAEPVRHGRWIPTELSRTIGMFIGVECSLCSFEKIGHGYKYCPSCGAKMDEEVQ